MELNSIIHVNSGDKCLFWKDKWINGQSLKTLFPALNLKESEVEDVAHLLNLSPIINTNNGPDQRVWLAGNHGFPVAECCKALEDEGLIMFPYKSMWNPRIPQKAAESNQHIFLHCETTRSVWHYFLSYYKLQWVFQDCVRNTIWKWRRKKGAARSIKKKIWDMYPFAIWWAGWIERNDRLFDDRYNPLDSIIDSVKVFMFNWCVGTDIFQGYPLNTVLQNLEDAVRYHRFSEDITDAGKQQKDESLEDEDKSDDDAGA
ncbi:uncharacterized protein LOC113315314 [Papaver somniferum]|uniref:uncharacterized protein LOC113315314 n=1 Tax=Papaver somniferum TaxID=3469 RepID=UPI000E701FF1|nr:uncharacterized protein LOC113315314 [Papaver somniferum]